MEFENNANACLCDPRNHPRGSCVEKIGFVVTQDRCECTCKEDAIECKCQRTRNPTRSPRVAMVRVHDTKCAGKSVGCEWIFGHFTCARCVQNDRVAKPRKCGTDFGYLASMRLFCGKPCMGDVCDAHTGMLAVPVTISQSQNTAKTILAMGYHHPEGARHWVMVNGLKAHGWTVIECCTTKKGFFAKCADLWRQYRSRYHEAEIVLVTFPCQYIVPIIWLFTRFPKKLLIIDAFISLYDSKVTDREAIRATSVEAMCLRFLDRLSGMLADGIVVDTPEHGAFFHRTFSYAQEKLIVVPIGCRNDLFMASGSEKKKHEIPQILFHGTFIPLQGIDTIIRAMGLLQNNRVPAHLTLIGRGQTFARMEKLATELRLQNVTFAGSKTPAEVVAAIHDADVCLGIFGTSDKADRVIPHKAYEIIACGKPLITGDTTAARRVFANGTSALLTKPGVPQALADALEKLIREPDMASRMGKKGLELSLERFQPATIVTGLDAYLVAHSHGAKSLHHRRSGIPGESPR